MSAEQIIEQGEDPGVVLTEAEKSALIERWRERMAEPGYAATLETPPNRDELRVNKTAEADRDNAGEGQVVGSPAVPGPQRLIEGEVIRPKHGATRDLVPVPPGTCPACGAELHVGSSAQPAMFIHGGYGEARRHTERSCSCGWNGVGAGDFVSENPRSLA